MAELNEQSGQVLGDKARETAEGAAHTRPGR